MPVARSGLYRSGRPLNYFPTNNNLKQLKIPTLNSVIDLDESSDVKKDIDPATGKEIYVYSYSGDFKSDAVNIDPFHVEAPVLTPNEIEVHLNVPAAGRAKRAAAEALHYKIKEMETTFDYNITGIDEAVKEITALSTPGVKFNIAIHFPAVVTQNADAIVIEKLEVEFPKGLVMAQGSPSVGSYDPASGIVTINNTPLGANGVLNLELVSTRLNVDQPVKDGKFVYANAITVKDGGDLKITPKEGVTLATDFRLSTDYKLSSFEVTKFAGAVNKPIDGLDSPNILLNDLPDFLTGEGTNLVLGNPQLYLTVNNPVSQYFLEAHTGLSITPERNNVAGEAITLPDGLTIGDNKPAGADYKYVLSPDGDATVPVAGYEDAKKQAYPGLGNVLAGNGMPSKLTVDFANPTVYGDDVVDFPLDGSIAPLKGEYIFRAPLALEEGTQIYYSGTKDDWSSEDLDRLNVTYMTVNAVASSDLPASVELSARLIDKDGKLMGVCDPITLPAMAENQQISFTIKAEGDTPMNNIDGIDYHVVCAVKQGDPGAGEAISPEQNVVLKEVRAKVNGFYLYEDK